MLYVSPLKALAVDVERNLRTPLAGLTRIAERRGLPAPDISVGVRSGDTPPVRRRQLIAQPPDVLITTPESLFLMLTSAARETLAGVQTVIVDEIHAIAAGKRGAHLALSLERLDDLREEAGPRSASGCRRPYVRLKSSPGSCPDNPRRPSWLRVGQDLRPLRAGAGARHGQPGEQQHLARRRGAPGRPDRIAQFDDRVRQFATARRATYLAAE